MKKQSISINKFRAFGLLLMLFWGLNALAQNPCITTRTVDNVYYCPIPEKTTAVTLEFLSNGPAYLYNSVLPGMVFTENCDGTAQITGRVCGVDNDGNGTLQNNACWNLNISLSGQTNTLPDGITNVANCGEKDVSNWYYYPTQDIILTGVEGGIYEGAILKINGNIDHTFQVGLGASSNIEIGDGIGAALWGTIEFINGGINNIRLNTEVPGSGKADLQFSLSEPISNCKPNICVPMVFTKNTSQQN